MDHSSARALLERLREHVERSGVQYTNLHRVVFPAAHPGGAPLLKAHLLDYYLRAAPAILPHVTGRPLALRRYPDGVAGDAFYTKDWRDATLPPGVDGVEVWSESRGAPLRYAVARGVDALGWNVQQGAVEVHTWLSRVGDDPAACRTAPGLGSPACGLKRPDVLLLDLDPYPRARRGGVAPKDEAAPTAAAWRLAVEGAREARAALQGLGLDPYVKSSGKRGLHLCVPVAPELPFATVRATARTIGHHLARRRPDLFTLSYDAHARRGRVFVDANQNARGKTIAAPYSVRPTPRATVSTPLAWRELEDAAPWELTVAAVLERLEAGHDPWRGFWDAPAALTALVGDGG